MSVNLFICFYIYICESSMSVVFFNWSPSYFWTYLKSILWLFYTCMPVFWSYLSLTTSSSFCQSPAMSNFIASLFNPVCAENIVRKYMDMLDMQLVLSRCLSAGIKARLLISRGYLLTENRLSLSNHHLLSIAPLLGVQLHKPLLHLS